VEDFDEKAIKQVLPANQLPKKGETLRSIALIERLLVSLGHDAAEVRPVMDRLRALNRLRVIDAHLLSAEDVSKEFQFWGVSAPPASRRAMWHTAVDAITNTLHEIAGLINAKPIPSPGP
jgi:hypothetical protein